MPFAINDNDVIVGWYTDSSGNNHGFVKTGGAFSSIDYPGAVEPFGTTIIGINNSGTMVGSYWDGSVSHGFLYSAGSFTALDFPGAIESQPFGINSNGDVVGFYWDGTETHGFLYSGGAFSSYDVPAALATQSYSINDNGQIVGGYNGNGNGFLYEGGVYTNLSVFGALYTAAYGINNSGQIVGSFSGAYPNNSGPLGFLYQEGEFVIIDFPASGGTSAYGINNLGEIVGSFSWGIPAPPAVLFTYTTNNSTITITGCIESIGYVGAVTIPATINGLPVTSIGGDAFTNNASLTSVTIPDSVTNIGDAAFSSDSGLTSVMIGNGVSFIGDEAFSLCTNLTAVYCLSDAPGLGSNVFYQDDNATVYYSAGTMGWGATFGGLPAMLGSALIPAAYVVTNGTITITDYIGSGGAVIIPATISGLQVTGIGDNAFSGSTGLTSVTIGTNVASIGDDAFSGCTGLTSVTIPGSVTNIGDAAFSGCAGLTSITIGTNVASIEDSAFSSCTSLTSVYFQGNAPSVGLSVFNSDTNATVYYLAGTTGWGSTFAGLPAFLWDALLPAAYVITNGTITITHYAGWGGALIIPATIGGVQVTGIGDDAFAGCAGLTSVTIPGSVTNIGDGAFSGCVSLNVVCFNGNAPGVGLSVFNSDTGATVYYLPGTTGWGSTFAGLPALLWNAQAQSGGDSFGVGMNGFGFNITGTSNLVVVVEAANNLAHPNWLPVGTNTLTSGSSYFSDPAWTNYDHRFYRLSAP